MPVKLSPQHEKFKALTPSQQFQEFITWLMLQNPEEEFQFADSKDCALARFARDKFPLDDVSGGSKTITIWYNRDTCDCGESAFDRIGVIPHSHEHVLRNHRTMGGLQTSSLITNPPIFK